MRTLVLLRGERMALAGLAVLCLYFAVAVFAPLIAPADPTVGDLAYRFAPPFWMEGGDAHRLFGADALGRDLLSRIVWGARASLAIGGLAVLASAAFGVALGCVAAYVRGWLDTASSRAAEFLLAFPLLIFAIGVLAVFGPSFWVIVMALAFKSWVEFFRVARGEALVQKTLDYVTAARTIGASHARIIARHILPNIVHTALVLVTLRFGYLVIMEASLSFLGLGVQPPTPAWGSMVADGRNFMLDAWWVATFPGIALVLLVLSLNVLGEGLREALDPRLRSGAEAMA